MISALLASDDGREAPHPRNSATQSMCAGLLLRGGIPFGFIRCTPFLRILVVHLFHPLRDIGMHFGDVRGQLLDEFIPGICRDFLVASSADLFAS